MKQIEWLTDGWVKFQRIYCKNGFIDYWFGNASDNPNKEEQKSCQFNSTTSYFRLNGIGEWLHKNDFESGFFINVLNNKTLFDSTYIWNVYLEK